MKYKHDLIAGIDIGSNGGMCVYRVSDGAIFSYKPADFKTAFEAFKRTKNRIHIVYIEKLHAYPQMSSKAVWGMAQNQGIVMGLIEAMDIDAIWVTAQAWQKPLEMPKKQEYKVRKQNLINKAKELFPEELIYHWKADAMLIMDYGRKQDAFD